MLLGIDFSSLDKRYYIYGGAALAAIIVVLVIVLSVALRKYKIEFFNKVVEANEPLETKKITRGKKVELPVLSAEGYDFVGWFYDPKCTELCDIEKMPAKNLVLYAGWRRKKKIKKPEPEQPTLNINDAIFQNLSFRISLDW